MDEGIGFREVGRHAALRGRIGDHSEFLCPTVLTDEDGDDIDELPVRNTGEFEICRIDEYDPLAAGDPTIAIVETDGESE